MTRFALLLTTMALLSTMAFGCSKAEPINESHTGNLEDSDPRLADDNSLYDEYTFKVEQGMKITIAMNSDAFDTYLILQDGAGEKIGENDDVGEDKNSKIEMTAPSSGTYTVVANSYDEEGKGAYTLTIQTAAAAGG